MKTTVRTAVRALVYAALGTATLGYVAGGIAVWVVLW